MVHPRYKRYVRQTLTFGLLWFAFGMLYVFIEQRLLGGLTVYPTTGNHYDFRRTLIYAGAGSFTMGLIQEWVIYRRSNCR